MKVPRAYQLGEVSNLTNFIQESFGVAPKEDQLPLIGRNWGDVDIHGNMQTFQVGSKQASEVPLADVAQTQLRKKNDVCMEFPVDDTAGANELDIFFFSLKDSLIGLCFHVPNSYSQYAGDENHAPAQVLLDKVSLSGDEAVVAFDGISILTPRYIEELIMYPTCYKLCAILVPSYKLYAKTKTKSIVRGCYSVELHVSFFQIQDQTTNFKIQYSSVVRLFLLPKILFLALKQNLMNAIFVLNIIVLMNAFIILNISLMLFKFH